MFFAGLALAIALFGSTFATRTYLAQTAQRGQTTLGLAVAALQGHLNRFEPLPALIADHEMIRELVRDPDNPQLRDEANRYLKKINALLKSSDIYVMAPDGTTIVASNYDTDLSFVGENFSYRPYYQQAMKGEPGRFFALGTTSLKRGYYFSSPVRDGGAIRGVVVFKVDLDDIEDSWASGDYEIIVTDPQGIVFMTSRSEWLYAGMLPLTEERLSQMRGWRRYADTPLRELPITNQVSENGRDVIRIRGNGTDREFLVESKEMPEAGWTVSVLMDTRAARAQALTGVITAVLLVLLAGLATAFVLQRRAQLAERLRIQRAAQEELEGRVEERTADLAAVNQRLENEVTERRATEMQLRQTQSDLVQAGKLAALGQMSAALSHEFNQPLAAVKTYAENGATLIDRDRSADARDNLVRISSLADRMATISRHLRNFAREPNQKLGPVLLQEVINDTVEIVTPRLKSAGVVLETKIDPPTLAVRAGAVRLQQVLVNLITNAADALEGRAERNVTISAQRKGSKVFVSVRDNGPGVAEAIRDRIFDPFYSTKGVGKGLGLGLSISYNIIKDFRGQLTVKNHPDGGALFTLELDAARIQHKEAAE
ncbi:MULTISPECIES: sensor histidine kinase [Mesorhizobium]|uniref:C4-dicarboxylate transport sensor protein DctB n=1 Tax=Mesorhizobium denitrificans TaxID=2294114 RepID=A0A371XBN9_9HYPH|nr:MULTISPECIES: sensor histidine kinase [Mesorhizobium]RFC66643.1 sensor histidine kinase [Mesorhizobium denitrificans]